MKRWKVVLVVTALCVTSGLFTAWVMDQMHPVAIAAWIVFFVAIQPWYLLISSTDGACPILRRLAQRRTSLDR
jgi:hypothetical protein